MTNNRLPSPTKKEGGREGGVVNLKKKERKDDDEQQKQIYCRKSSTVTGEPVVLA
jgi:hypothetical protein